MQLHKSHTTALKNEDGPQETYGALMVKRALKNLPTEIQLEWAKDSAKNKMTDSVRPMEFLEEQLNN